MIKHDRIKSRKHFLGVLLTPEGTCNLVFGSAFIVLPTSKDLTQVRAEMVPMVQTSVYPNLSELCLSPSVGVCAEMTVGWVLQKEQWQDTPSSRWCFAMNLSFKNVLVVKKISSVNEQRGAVVGVGSGFLEYTAAFQPNKLDFVLPFPQTLFWYLRICHLNWEQLSQLKELLQFFTSLVFSLAPGVQFIYEQNMRGYYSDLSISKLHGKSIASHWVLTKRNVTGKLNVHNFLSSRWARMKLLLLTPPSIQDWGVTFILP